MDQTLLWRQVSIVFPDWSHAEPTALRCLAPHLSTAEADGLIGGWFFIRKYPCWRVRYQPTTDGAETHIEQHLDELTACRQIDRWTPVVYEPEIHAFGGAEAMATAHRLFHRDSRCLLTYLQGSGRAGTHRREISMMLCSILMRSAGQDWYEQGDVWARVAAHRAPLADPPTDKPAAIHASVRRLMSVDAESQMRENAPLAYLAQWADSYAAAGAELASLAAAGALHRGLRDVLAHHVIFAWNRLGLPYPDQAVLAATAATVVFGPDPATASAGEERRWTAQNTG